MTSPEPRFTVTVITPEGQTLYQETYAGDGADYFDSAAPLHALICTRILHRDIPADEPVAILVSSAGRTQRRMVPLRPHSAMDDYLIPDVLARHRPDSRAAESDSLEADTPR